MGLLRSRRAHHGAAAFAAFTASIAFVFGVLGAGCSDAASTTKPSDPVVTPPAACAADERASADGADGAARKCELFASTGPCAAGQRPAIGSESCVAVGTTTCARGFERDKSGWGCAPIMPSAACTGATRPRLGDRVCVPVGDCNAAYPPAGAILVDPALDPGAVDATHVRTVADALSLAAGGATIALVDGAHSADTFAVTKALTIVGRCAAKTKLVAPSPAPSSGISIRANATIRGLTIEGYTEALAVSGAGVELVAEDIVVEQARSRAIYALRSGKVILRRSVVRGTTPLGPSAQTIAVLGGTSGKIEIDDSAILASIDGALAVTDNVTTSALVKRSIVQDTKPRADGKGGGALRAFEGAHLDITESAIVGSTGAAILTIRRNAPPPEVTLTRSVVSGTVATRGTGTAIGTAINAAYDAKVRIDESTVSDSEGIALYVGSKAQMTATKSVVVRVRRTVDLSSLGGTSVKDALLSLEDCAIVAVGGLGLGTWEGGRLALTRSLIRDIGGDIAQGFALGQGLNASASSTIDAKDSAIVDALEIGVSATKAGSTVVLDHVLVTRSAGAMAPRFGHGVLSVDSAGITMLRSIIERQVGAGLFFASGGGVASALLVRDNAVGVHVQEGSSLVEADLRPDTVPQIDLVVTKDTQFVGNATRVGAGTLPLPAPLSPPAPGP